MVQEVGLEILTSKLGVLVSYKDKRLLTGHGACNLSLWNVSHRSSRLWPVPGGGLWSITRLVSCINIASFNRALKITDWSYKSDFTLPQILTLLAFYSHEDLSIWCSGRPFTNVKFWKHRNCSKTSFCRLLVCFTSKPVKASCHWKFLKIICLTLKSYQKLVKKTRKL